MRIHEVERCYWTIGVARINCKICVESSGIAIDDLWICQITFAFHDGKIPPIAIAQITTVANDTLHQKSEQAIQ